MKIVVNRCFGGFCLSKEAARWLLNNGATGELKKEINDELADQFYGFFLHDDRSNPLLVRCVEELGDSSWGETAKLEIVEIPDTVEWEIDDYDGNESIAEKHRSW